MFFFFFSEFTIPGTGGQRFGLEYFQVAKRKQKKPMYEHWPGGFEAPDEKTNTQI